MPFVDEVQALDTVEELVDNILVLVVVVERHLDLNLTAAETS